MEHRDLNDDCRLMVEDYMETLVGTVLGRGNSLGIAREAMINAFDEEAEALDG